MSAQEEQPRNGLHNVAAAAIYFLCALCVQIMASLAIWALVPVAAGMTPTVILSDSMKPYVNAGDIVLTAPPGGDRLERGQVITFDDPAFAGRLLTHRIVERNADGSYDTRGDANLANDSASVPADSIRGVGRIVVPGAGVPIVWARSGKVGLAVVWMVGLALAVAYMRAFGRRTSPAGGEPAAAPAAHACLPPVRPLRRRVWSLAVVVWPSLLILVAFLAPRTLASEAAFAAERSNPANAYTAANSFCTAPGNQTVIPVADALTLQSSATSNFGTSATSFGTRAVNNGAGRSLVRFTLPAVPSRCVMTGAKLRIYVSAGVANRTLQALRVNAAWAETSVTWNNQPAVTGTAATVPSRGTAGWLEWTVTDQVAAMYSGTNNGFQLRDATETGGSTIDNLMHPRENTNKPELVVTFG